MQEALEQAKGYGRLLENTENNLFLAINVTKESSEPDVRSIELWCDAELSENKLTIKIDASGKLVISDKKRRIG